MMQAKNLGQRISVKICYRKLSLPSDSGLTNGDVVVLTTYLYAPSCLALYTKEQFSKVIDALHGTNMSESLASKIESIRRVVIGSALECVVENGKITIPPYLMEQAGLQSEAIWTQHDNRIEICSPEYIHSQDISAS